MCGWMDGWMVMGDGQIYRVMNGNQGQIMDGLNCFYSFVVFRFNILK